MESLGYLGIGLLMFLENIIPPIPSELILPLAGFTAAQGRLSFAGVWAAALAGSLLGQLPLYYLGRLAGAERLGAWAERYGRWLLIGRAEIDLAQSWFDRHGGKAVLLCRLVPGTRTLISVPAGMARMPLLPFLAYSAVGMGLWALVLAYLGLLLGQNYALVGRYLEPVSYLVLIVLFLGPLFWLLRRRRGARRAPGS